MSIDELDNQPELQDPQSDLDNPFLKFFSFLVNVNDPERKKRKFLKQLGQLLKKQRYKFYKPKGQEALPGMARFFFEIYKVVGPAQMLLENAQASGALKNIVIECFLSPEQQKLMDSISEQSIRELAQVKPIQEVFHIVKDKLVNFMSEFDMKLVNTIDATYSIVSLFLRFIRFDFYFLLKKFDSSMPERSFSYTPKFDTINGDYIVDDLKDFLEIAPLLDPTSDWDKVFDVLKNYKNIDVLDRKGWKKTVAGLRAVVKSEILNQIVCHIEEDPFMKFSASSENDKIVDSYLSKIKTQAEMVIQKIAQEKKNSQQDKLLTQIFGTTAIVRMRNYSEKNNVLFSKSMLGGYIHTGAANYLKAFLIDYVKKDLREMINLLVIKGQWTSNIFSQQLSESFHQLMELSDQLVALDDSLADEEALGSKVKLAAKRADRDKKAQLSLRTTLKEINEKVAKIMQLSGSNLVVVGKNLKSIIDDYSTEPHQIIVNWNEVDNLSDGRFEQKAKDVYKKIYYFIQLMQMFIKKQE